MQFVFPQQKQVASQKYEVKFVEEEAIKVVGDSSGIWKAEPEQFSAISEALAMAIEMQKLCTRRELRGALEAVYEANEYHNKVNQIKNKLKAQP